MTKKGRTLVQKVKAVFKLLHKEKNLYLSDFRKIGLDNYYALGYILMINEVSQEINQTNLIEVTKIGKTTTVKFNNGSSTIENTNTVIVHTDYQKSDIVQAIETATNKLAYLINIGGSARKEVTVEAENELPIGVQVNFDNGSFIAADPLEISFTEYFVKHGLRTHRYTQSQRNLIRTPLPLISQNTVNSLFQEMRAATQARKQVDEEIISDPLNPNLQQSLDERNRLKIDQDI